jgi:hypothetical protein
MLQIMHTARKTPNFWKKVTVVNMSKIAAAVKVVTAAETTEIPISTSE